MAHAERLKNEEQATRDVLHFLNVRHEPYIQALF